MLTALAMLMLHADAGTGPGVWVKAFEGPNSTDGGLWGVEVLNRVTVDTYNHNDGGVQAISATALPLPTGAATEATLAQRTKPSDQQHVLLDTGGNVIGHVIVDTAPTTPVTGVFYQSTQPVSAVGPDGGTTLDVSGSVVSLAGQPLQVNVVSQPLNPFLPRCNPVRRTRCQP